MVQAKISAFFKSATVSDEASVSLHCQTKGDENPEDSDVDVIITYKRRVLETKSDSEEKYSEDGEDTGKSNVALNASPIIGPCSLPNVIKKKTKYVQSHLDLGQKDFHLRTCSSCGLRYTCGEEEDEKAHKEYHKNYLQGIKFKGWCNERVVSAPETTEERIVLVLANDPPTQKRKVQEVAKSMETDLHCEVDWLLDQFYQAYLFISKNRIAGCLIIEPIQKAYKLVPHIISSRNSSNGLDSEATESDLSLSEANGSNSGKHSSSILQFGNVNLQREAVKRKHTLTDPQQEPWCTGAILCEEDSVPAVCGVRAIWVAPSHRRRHIATKLLDAARKNFSTERKVEPSECAFSHPTSLGCAFAASYCRSMPLLVYKDSC